MMNDDRNDEDEHQLGTQHHDMPLGTSSATSYYRLFASVTENGRVFAQPESYDNDLPLLLTHSEKIERENYKNTIENLIIQYNEMEYPVATTKEEVLQQRVVAACLASEHASSRAKSSESRAGRVYPPNIYLWENFKQEVEQYKVNEGTSTLVNSLGRVFISSLTYARRPLGRECQEQEYLASCLYQTLVTAGIVNSVIPGYTGVVGNPDFCVLNEQGEVTIICECKSTQNLLLPMMAVDCKTAYDTAYAHGVSEMDRSPAWSNVAHPIVQLLSYMVDNDHRYGALTSATRTYFVKIQVQPGEDNSANINEVTDTADKVQATDAEQNATPKRARYGAVPETTTQDRCQGSVSQENFVNENEIKVLISDAWCVGEADYLRAWAYVHNLYASTIKRQQKLKSCNMEFGRPTHKGALDYVPFDEISILGVVGEGRNGGCFNVKWKGTEYAMKQFDIGRDGDEFFQNEIRAYMKLRDSWGVLVPRPIFWSESFSGGVMFLGLQLGREPRSDDDLEKFYVVLKLLEEQYGIRHNDTDRGTNMIVISDADGNDRVVAIDFEYWDDVPVKNLILQ